MGISVLPGARIDATAVGRRFETPAGPVDAIRNVSLNVAPGEFWCLVGPSGCGKSTFLRLVAGLEYATSGTLIVSRDDGRTPSNAVVFQGRSLFPWMTVRDNVSYGLRLRGTGKAERHDIATGLLETVGLGKFAQSYPHQISEGMRQRVAIARALAVDPDILLMDEPFGALDEQTRYLLQEELLRIWQATGKTVLFVTHSIEEAILLADKVAVMSAQPGTIRDVIDIPFARPRSQAEARAHPEFSRVFDRIWHQLREEVRFGRLEQVG